ncbi:MAG: endonuclease/exonuclease/phosphatase family protein, partial [Planctomycetota bacterium]
MAWNTANRPNNSSEDALYRTVFQAIGNENVGNGSMPPSIIALQETDNQQGGGDSIDRIENLLETLYPTISYGYAVTNLDSGDDANGFVYDTGLFDLVETTVVEEVGNMQSFAHNNMRARFRPENTTGDDDFYLYSTHLKAGSGNNDVARRTAEANAIRVDIDSLGAGQDVVVLGDFNIGGSSEGAYQNFLASGNGQLVDPIDTPGEWKNNSSFVGIH